MKKSLLLLFVGSIASFSYVYASIPQTNNNLSNVSLVETSLFKLEKFTTKTEVSLYPPGKKRRGSPYRSGTGGKKWGGKVGACAKKRRR
jgi:hypothetical protein